jgi:hypothetical protein
MSLKRGEEEIGPSHPCAAACAWPENQKKTLQRNDKNKGEKKRVERRMPTAFEELDPFLGSTHAFIHFSASLSPGAFSMSSNVGSGFISTLGSSPWMMVFGSLG